MRPVFGSSGLILISMPLSCNLYHSRGCVPVKWNTSQRLFLEKLLPFFRIDSTKTHQRLSYFAFPCCVFVLQCPHVPRPAGRHSEQACRRPWGGKGPLLKTKKKKPVTSAVQLLQHLHRPLYFIAAGIRGRKVRSRRWIKIMEGFNWWNNGTKLAWFRIWCFPFLRKWSSPIYIESNNQAFNILAEVEALQSAF